MIREFTEVREWLKKRVVDINTAQKVYKKSKSLVQNVVAT